MKLQLRNTVCIFSDTLGGGTWTTAIKFILLTWNNVGTALLKKSFLDLWLLILAKIQIVLAYWKGDVCASPQNCSCSSNPTIVITIWVFGNWCIWRRIYVSQDNFAGTKLGRSLRPEVCLLSFRALVPVSDLDWFLELVHMYNGCSIPQSYKYHLQPS